MKTDTIFYSLFQTFPSIFFELIDQSPEQTYSYEFTSREIKQLAFRLDGLFLPTSNDSEKPFYLVEVQFQPDEDLYYRLFGELFLYLRQYKPPYPWQVVAIYPSRTVEREQTLQFGELLTLNRVKRIYLDELGQVAKRSLGVGVVKLVIEPEQTAGELARRLIEQARQQLTNDTTKRDLIDLIETIIVYKLPQKSRVEIEEMLGLSELKQTKVYQEALQEGEQRGEQRGELKAKLEAIPELIELGLSVAQIAGALKLPLEVVKSKALSFHEQNLTAFIELLNTQRLPKGQRQRRSLFSPQDLAELAQLIAPLPDEMEELSKAIAIWCNQATHSPILKVMLQVRSTLSSDSFENVSETNTSKAKTSESRLNKLALQNAIGEN
ncbi:MAG: Rpn family recombination-promoting nuclease/putative transposase [Symploca sp. SIO2E9]|nr:Rpn family recombination-promoting nuclease/putative transposase [Symploca sp. SIO2E9]